MREPVESQLPDDFSNSRRWRAFGYLVGFTVFVALLIDMSSKTSGGRAIAALKGFALGLIIWLPGGLAYFLLSMSMLNSSSQGNPSLMSSVGPPEVFLFGFLFYFIAIAIFFRLLIDPSRIASGGCAIAALKVAALFILILLISLILTIIIGIPVLIAQTPYIYEEFTYSLFDSATATAGG